MGSIVASSASARIGLLVFAVAAGMGAALIALDPLVGIGVVAISVVAVLALVLLRDPCLFLAIFLGLHGPLLAAASNAGTVSIAGLQLNVAKAATLLASALCLARLVFALNTRLRVVPTVPAALVLLAAIVLSAFRTPPEAEGIAVLGRVASGTVVLIFCIVFCRTEGDFWRIASGAMISATSASIFAFLDLRAWRASADAIESSYHRGEGQFGGAVGTGTMSFVAIGLGAAMFMGAGSSRLRRHVGVAMIAVNALGILATVTRTAMVGALLMAALLVLSAKTSRRSRAQIVAPLLVLGAVAFSFLLISEDTRVQRFKDVPFLSQAPQVANYAAGSGRGIIWSAVGQLLISQGPVDWIFGNGLLAVPRDVKPIVGRALDAHNSSLDMLYDAGLFGLAAYWVFAVLLIRGLWRAQASFPDHRGLAGAARAWSTYMVAYFLSTEMFNGWIYAAGARWYSLAISGALIGVGSHMLTRSGRSAAGTEEPHPAVHPIAPASTPSRATALPSITPR